MAGLRYLVAVDNCFPVHPSGAARVAWDFAQAVQREGGCVCHVCFSFDENASTYELGELDGMQVLWVKKPNLPVWDPRRMSAAIDAVASAVEATLSSDDWDLVHIHSSLTGHGVMQGMKALQARPGAGKGPEVVKTIHSPNELEYLANNHDKPLLGKLKQLFGLPVLHKMERRELDASKALHVLSQFTQGELRKLHGATREMTVIPHWRRSELVRTMSKAEARLKLGWPLEEKIFFTIRYHGHRTGIDVAIEAVAPLARAGRCRFFIGGSGRLMNYHANLIANRNVEDRVHLMGRISDEELALAYQAADAFLLPTRSLECFGLIILEAYAYGCPVIGTRAGAIPELIAPISPSLLVPPDDITAMQQKIEAFLGGSLEVPSPDDLIAYVDERFGRDVIVPQLLDWIHKAARA